MKAFTFAFAAVTLLTLTTLAFADDTSIHAEYTANYDRLRPNPYKDIHLKNSIDLILTGNNEVRESYKREAGKFSDAKSAANKLGSNWTVQEGNKIQRIIDLPQNTTEMTVTVDGKACKFDIQFKLKPGFKEFTFIKIMDGKIGYFTQPMVQTTTCTIQ
jgi:hypothetical protein